MLLTSSSLTGLDTPQTNEIQEITVDATGGSFTITAGARTITVAYGTSAQALEVALQALTAIGLGNVAVTLMDDVYVLRFQGALSNTNVDQLDGSGANRTKQARRRRRRAARKRRRQIDDGRRPAVNGFAQTAADANGQESCRSRQRRPGLTVEASGGSYTLSLLLTARITRDARRRSRSTRPPTSCRPGAAERDRRQRPARSSSSST